MNTFWERTAHSVNQMFSLLCLFVVLDISHLRLEGGNLVLIAPGPGHFFPFTFEIVCWDEVEYYHHYYFN